LSGEAEGDVVLAMGDGVTAVAGSASVAVGRAVGEVTGSARQPKASPAKTRMVITVVAYEWLLACSRRLIPPRGDMRTTFMLSDFRRQPGMLGGALDFRLVDEHRQRYRAVLPACDF
jgi:hypothetical protein